MKVTILILAAVVLCSSILKADPIYSNYGAGMTFTAGTGLTPGYSAVASSFTANANYSVDQLEVAAYRASPDTRDSVEFDIYNDLGGVPGTSLESFALTNIGYYGTDSYAASTPLPGNLIANSVAHPILTSGQEYWIVMSGVSPGDVIWNADGTGIEGAATYLAPDPNSDIPAQWSKLPNYTQGAFAISGTLLPAPEPGTLLMTGAGVCCLLGMVQRRRRHRKDFTEDESASLPLRHRSSWTAPALRLRERQATSHDSLYR
jgi:hypothetical protein